MFALSGALDLAYLRSSALQPPVYLVGRGGTLELDLPRRLGATAELRCTDHPDEGWAWVRDEIDAGRPVMAWADLAELPYLRVRLRMSRHDIVIIGYDEQNQIAHVVDNDRADIQEVCYDALTRARSSTAFPQPTRHGTYFIRWPPAVPDLRAVAADAFAQAAAAMNNSDRTAIATPDPDAISATGIAAAHAFAADIPQWPSLFDEHQLHNVLLGLAAFIEKAGTGGGLFRRLLAHGSAHAAELADNLPELEHHLAQALDHAAQDLASSTHLNQPRPSPTRPKHEQSAETQRG